MGNFPQFTKYFVSVSMAALSQFSLQKIQMAD